MFLSKYLTSCCMLFFNASGNILDYIDNIMGILKKNKTINYIISPLSIYYNAYYNYINDLLVEPENDFLRSASLNKNNDLELYYHNIEEIANLNNKTSNLITKKDGNLITYNFSDSNQEYVSSIITNSKTINPLFVDIHNPDNFDLKQYLHNFIKVYKNTNIRSVEKGDIKPFLAIQYSHPEQSDKLTILLKKKYYASHNDILDSIFIKTYLSKTYNKNNYIFDDKYEIIIIDHNANFHTLKFNQYIHFEYKKWSIYNK